jgi:UDP-glucose 4-epimerase
MKVLIAGGAGYIGSTVASACSDAGIIPVILDSLVTGRREFTVGRGFYQGDIADEPLIDRIFAEHRDLFAVIHCAALIVVPDSVADPVRYYRANVTKSLEFAAHLVRNGCERLIFSSSAAIYAASEDLTVDVESPIDPQSPYARTKAVCEAMFADVAAAQPIRVLSLRYFNPVGADPQMRTGLQLPRPTHALGKMIQAQEHGVPFLITGTDYPTRDGSGIRDYIHVWDLATAHVAALGKFDVLPGPTTVINVGTGTGTTVRELLDAFNSVSESPVEAREAGRRPGDVAGAYTVSNTRSACSTGGRSMTSPKASAIRCSGPRSETRSCLEPTDNTSALRRADPALPRPVVLADSGRVRVQACTLRWCWRRRCVRCSYRCRGVLGGGTLGCSGG